MEEFTWFDHIIAFFVLVFFPLMSIKTAQQQNPVQNKEDNESFDDFIQELPEKTQLYYHNGLILIIGCLLVMTSWNLSIRTWESLGFQWPHISQVVLILTVLLTLVYLAEISYGLINKKYLRKKLNDLSYILPLNNNEYIHYIFMAFAAGICEEIVFRGFLIRYLDVFFISFPLPYIWAIIIPAFSFAISHSYQGIWAVIKIFAIAILLGFIFYFSGSLLIVVIIHILVDLISGSLGLFVKPEKEET